MRPPPLSTKEGERTDHRNRNIPLARHVYPLAAAEPMLTLKISGNGNTSQEPRLAKRPPPSWRDGGRRTADRRPG